MRPLMRPQAFRALRILGGMNASPPKLLTAPILARRLRVTRRWLDAEAEANRIPALSAGDRFLFDPDAVERVLLERAQRQAEEHVQ